MVEVEFREAEEVVVMEEMMAEVDSVEAGERDVVRGDEGQHCHRSVRRDEERTWPCQILVEEGRRWIL